jgi:hypothetical protein
MAGRVPKSRALRKSSFGNVSARAAAEFATAGPPKSRAFKVAPAAFPLAALSAAPIAIDMKTPPVAGQAFGVR